MEKPTCIGFILDGNRRFAKANGLTTYEGHKRGQEVFLDSIRFIKRHGIPHAVYYAFSTENWHRQEAEVSYLMELFQRGLTSLQKELATQPAKESVRVRFIGDRARFSASLQSLMTAIEDETQVKVVGKSVGGYTTIWIALSYGGRAEIITAVNQAIENHVPVTEASFTALLDTAELPEPDIIVRTSGEQRLSNFLTWHSVYSELYFIDKHWPALTETDFTDILREYETRNRRRGR